MLELIREYLDISDNSCTGLVWKKIPKNGRSEVGKPALTSTDGPGYFYGRILGQRVAAHRAVFALVNDYLPEQVDHINGLRKDNQPSNLRASTAQVNQHNRVAKGYKLSSVGRYQARIYLDGKQVNLGSFATKQEAQAAYLAAKRAYHPTAPERCYVK